MKATGFAAWGQHVYRSTMLSYYGWFAKVRAVMRATLK